MENKIQEYTDFSKKDLNIFDELNKKIEKIHSEIIQEGEKIKQRIKFFKKIQEKIQSDINFNILNNLLFWIRIKQNELSTQKIKEKIILKQEYENLTNLSYNENILEKIKILQEKEIRISNLFNTKQAEIDEELREIEEQINKSKITKIRENLL